MKLFNQHNSDGYTDAQLAELNEEWENRVIGMGIDENDPEYDFQAKTFSDEVARR